MPNTIVLAKNFVPLLDDVYQRESVTSDLTGDPAMARAGANAREIVYPQIAAVTGLGDYDRNSGYTQGTVDLKWMSTEYNYDRGAKLSVDVMDNQETYNIVCAGNALTMEMLNADSNAMEAAFSALDTSTTSGLVEKAADVLALTLIKPEEIEVVSTQMEQDRADIDYIAMEMGGGVMAKTKTVEKSKNYEKVKNYYDRGLWSVGRVYNAVGKWITKEEYREMTGNVYSAEK